MESNVQKMRELVGTILEICTPISTGDEDDPVERIALLAEEALAIPLCNCNVGTAHEQAIRFDEFCQECEKCPLNEKRLNIRLVQCEFLWGQMPYNEGGAK